MDNNCRLCGQKINELSPSKELCWHRSDDNPGRGYKLLIVHQFHGLLIGHYDDDGWAVICDCGWVDCSEEDIEWWAYAPKPAWAAFS